MKAIDEGRISEHDEIFMDFVEAAERQQRENPDPEVLLYLEANRCEEEADWDGALTIYQQLLESAVESGHCQYRRLSHLCSFHHLLEDHVKALEFARAATNAARGYDVPLALSMAFEAQGACALLANLVTEATEVAEAALLLLDSRKIHDLQRGKCLVLRARCRMAAGDRRVAENDLEAAWPYLEPLSGSQFAAGVALRSQAGGRRRQSAKQHKTIRSPWNPGRSALSSPSRGDNAADDGCLRPQCLGRNALGVQSSVARSRPHEQGRSGSCGKRDDSRTNRFAEPHAIHFVTWGAPHFR